MAVNHDAVSRPQSSPYSKIGKFYSKYLPTDKETFEVRYTITGLIISLFSLQILFLYVLYRDTPIYQHAFYVLIASVHYGLYYGLKTGKLRLATPWLLFKITEIIGLIFAITRGFLYWHNYSKINLIFGIFLVAADMLMMFCLYKSQVEASDVKNFQIETESKKSTPEV